MLNETIQTIPATETTGTHNIIMLIMFIMRIIEGERADCCSSSRDTAVRVSVERVRVHPRLSPSQRHQNLKMDSFKPVWTVPVWC